MPELSFGYNPQFYCDYGTNIIVGERVFFNFNCVVLDVTYVRIGDRTLFGPDVQIYTATHLIDAATRASGVEFAKPITIGADVWIGGSAVINPGVSIGDRTIIDAGSVVTQRHSCRCICCWQSLPGDTSVVSVSSLELIFC